jgi:hypothetical protein
MKFTAAVLRMVGAIAIVVAVAATFVDSASRSTVNPFNFFGFFTIQGNLLTAAVFAVGIVGLTGRRQGAALVIARGCATTYMFVVGIVYNTLLVGLAGGVALPWANSILHVVMPLYAILDWIVFSDRPPLPWNRFWVLLVYPLAWLAVVLVRGATDGWVPYPFLDPALGYGIVALYAVGIAIAIGGGGAAVWGLSRMTITGRPAPSAAGATNTAATKEADDREVG